MTVLPEFQMAEAAVPQMDADRAAEKDGASARAAPAEPSQRTASADSADSAQSSTDFSKKPTCLIFLGMAGSGKTTLVQKITSYLYEKKPVPYVINLDPACAELPYPANIGM